MSNKLVIQIDTPNESMIQLNDNAQVLSPNSRLAIAK